MLHHREMTVMNSVVIAVAQFGATTQIAENLANAVTLIERAAELGADVVTLPENAMYSDPFQERLGEKYSEPLDGPFVTALQAAASRHGVHVVAGTTETNDDARPYNTLVHIGAAGEFCGLYRKVHLYDAFGYRESDTVKPAVPEALVFAVNGVTIGAATCYDLRFPEIFRFIADRGADVILLPANWQTGPLKEYHWETLIRARAIENTVYVAAAGQIGPASTGLSMIIDPAGIAIANAGEQPMGIACATASTERVAQVRKVNPSLANRQFTVVPRMAG
jgi:predicted amidohydrolase